MRNVAAWLMAAVCGVACAQISTPHTVQVGAGKQITLNMPADLDVTVAATGLKRVRFFAKAPDGRVFATTMHDLSDNTQGSLVILDGWDAKSGTFTRVTHYLDHLHNPNNLAFYTEPGGKSWLYLPLTDRLVRIPYKAGDNRPGGPAQTLIRLPDYGLNYKYGGWHLTRTVAVGTLHGKTRVFLTVGSSCNYCREQEVARASLLAMDPDGGHQQVLAHGLRNAVDLRYLPNVDGGALFASNMGDDHLGDQLPEDTFFELDSNAKPGGANVAAGQVPANYGWPTCYFAHGKPVLDTTPLPKLSDNAIGVAAHPASADLGDSTGDSAYGKQAGVAAAGTQLSAGGGHVETVDPNASLGQPPGPLTSCEHVPAAWTTFAAHSSPLGLEWFGAEDKRLGPGFLVALHGSGHTRIGTGYRVVRVGSDRVPRDFITGFLTRGPGGAVKINGRPCGVLRVGPDAFLLADDVLGVVYYVHPHGV